jgi:ABC-type glycerol-3-phosphate transport system substrate-binding protein
LIRAALAIAAAVALSACGEKPQTAGGVRSDTAPFQGTGVTTFTATGWKAGDRNSWEQQLKTRTQMGQNDYAKVN